MKLSKVFGIVLSLHVGVILLVMFQPSCQTTGGNARGPEGEANSSIDETSVQSFNQAVEVSNTNTDEKISGGNQPDQLAAPKRPKPGELIIPSEPRGFTDSKPSLLVPTETSNRVIDLRPSDLSIYKVVRGDTLWGIARKNGVSLASLLNANPNLDKSGRLSIDQEIMIPATSGTNSVTSSGPIVNDAPVLSLSGNSYRVEAGDTLSRIAQKFNVRLSELLKANDMSMSSIIRPGQTLSIPSELNNRDVGSSPSTQVTNRVVPPGASTHIVKKGENLSRISSIYGVSVSQIMEWNGLSNPSLIRAGQPLIVSQGVSETPSQPTPIVKDNADALPANEGGTLQDFFNESSTEDRPIIDAP